MRTDRHDHPFLRSFHAHRAKNTFKKSNGVINTGDNTTRHTQLHSAVGSVPDCCGVDYCWASTTQYTLFLMSGQL
jgi:hypothetical protein